MNRIFFFAMFLLSLEIAGYASSHTLPLLPAVARFIAQYPDAGTALDCQPATESLFGVKQHVILTTGEYDFYLSGDRVATIFRNANGIPELTYKNPDIKEGNSVHEARNIPASSVYPTISQPSSRPANDNYPMRSAPGRSGIPNSRDVRDSSVNTYPFGSNYNPNYNSYNPYYNPYNNYSPYYGSSPYYYPQQYYYPPAYYNQPYYPMPARTPTPKPSTPKMN